MGLFNKKESNEGAASNGFVSPKLFYVDCMKDYHDRAKELGYAEHDVLFIPELIEPGSKAVYWFLSNEELQKQFASPAEYYYVAVNTAIRCGILFGAMWHTDLPRLQKPGFVEFILENGPSNYTVDLIKKDLGMDDKAFGEFCTQIFLRWCEMHKPYWALAHPHEYTTNATLAAYQLGVSMILCRYGF